MDQVGSSAYVPRRSAPFWAGLRMWMGPLRDCAPLQGCEAHAFMPSPPQPTCLPPLLLQAARRCVRATRAARLAACLLLLLACAAVQVWRSHSQLHAAAGSVQIAHRSGSSSPCSGLHTYVGSAGVTAAQPQHTHRRTAKMMAAEVAPEALGSSKCDPALPQQRICRIAVVGERHSGEAWGLVTTQPCPLAALFLLRASSWQLPVPPARSARCTAGHSARRPVPASPPLRGPGDPDSRRPLPPAAPCRHLHGCA